MAVNGVSAALMAEERGRHWVWLCCLEEVILGFFALIPTLRRFSTPHGMDGVFQAM